MDDTLRIKQTYIPKKYWDKIQKIDIEADFDYGKNRTFQHYFITMRDGHSADACSIVELKNKIERMCR